MSSKEQIDLDIIAKISTGTISRKDGMKILNVSERTIRRYLAGYIKSGVLFVKHGNYQRRPSNRSDESLKTQVQKLVQEKYFDFNMTHCLEKLKSDEGIEIKRETFRHWCHEIQMVKKSKRRTAKARRQRQRMRQTGIMLQMDGSPHHWFGGKPSCLIAAIDDADSDVPYGEFFPAEDTISCMRVLQQIIEKRGIFQLLYVDRAGIFGGPKRAHFSQVKRALRELGIHIIFAHSAEAKGRIERLWGTLQDRLIPEMRIRNIRNYETANEFLQQHYLPNEYASRFKVVPENLQTAYKVLPANIVLDDIFCLKLPRTVKRDHTFSYQNEIYRIESPLRHSIYKQKIEVRTYQNLKQKFFFAGKEIEVSKVKLPLKQGAAQTIEIAEVDHIRTEKVRMDGHVHYGNCYYSVDEKYIGDQVSIADKEAKVSIYFKGKCIESHSKITQAYVRNSTRPEHMAPWRRALKATSRYRMAALKLGANVDQLILTVIERGQGFIDTKTIWGVIRFEKYYTPTGLNEACKIALELDTLTYRSVKALLKLQGNRNRIDFKIASAV